MFYMHGFHPECLSKNMSWNINVPYTDMFNHISDSDYTIPTYL